MAAEIPGNNPDPLPRNPTGPDGPRGRPLGDPELKGVPLLGPQPELPGQPHAEIPGPITGQPEAEDPEEREVLTPDMVTRRQKAVKSVLRRVPGVRDASNTVHSALLAVETGLGPTAEDRVTPSSQEAQDDGGLTVATVRTVRAAVTSHLKRQERDGLPHVDETELLEYLDMEELKAKVAMRERVIDTETQFYPLARDPEALAESTQRTREELEAEGFVPLEGLEVDSGTEGVTSKIFSFTGRQARQPRARTIVQMMRGTPREPEEYVSVLYKENDHDLQIYGRETEEGTEYFVFGGQEIMLMRAGNAKSLTIRDTDVEVFDSHPEDHCKEVRFENSHIGIMSVTNGKVVVDNGLIANAHIATEHAELVTTGTDIVSAGVDNGGKISMDESYTGTVLVVKGGLYETEGDVMTADLLTGSRAYIAGDCETFLGGERVHGYVLGRLGDSRVSNDGFITQVDLTNNFVRHITETDRTSAIVIPSENADNDLNYKVTTLAASFLGAIMEKDMKLEKAGERADRVFAQALRKEGINPTTFHFDLANYKKIIGKMEERLRNF